MVVTINFMSFSSRIIYENNIDWTSCNVSSASAFAGCEVFEFSHNNIRVSDVEICADFKEVENGIELSNFSENINATAYKNEPFGQLYSSVLTKKRVPNYLCEQFLKVKPRDVIVKTTKEKLDLITVVGKFAGYRWGNLDVDYGVTLKTIKKVTCLK